MLNIPRLSWRTAYMVAQGTGAAQSCAALPFSFFDAVTATEEEAREARFEANSERALLQAKKEAGWLK